MLNPTPPCTTAEDPGEPDGALRKSPEPFAGLPGLVSVQLLREETSRAGVLSFSRRLGEGSQEGRFQGKSPEAVGPNEVA